MKTEKVFKFICVGGYREEREALLSLIQLQKKYTNFSEKKKSFLKNQYIFWVIKSFDLVGIFIDKFCRKKIILLLFYLFYLLWINLFRHRTAYLIFKLLYTVDNQQNLNFLSTNQKGFGLIWIDAWCQNTGVFSFLIFLEL